MAQPEEISIDQLLSSNKEDKEEIERLRSIVEAFSREKREYIVQSPQYDNTLLFGLIGDTHFGSLYERADALEEFYRVCNAEKIKSIYHAGDVLAGHKVYRGQEFELYAFGFEKQLQAFAERAPTYKGVTTHFITGNHDASLKKLAGIDVGAALTSRRKDWICYGEDYARVTMIAKNGSTYTISLVHPDGGTPYAISYRTQKMIESLPGGEKPQMLGIGHLHKAEHLPNYRNVDGLMVGCFESQTPFMKRKPTAAHVGGWLVRVTLGAREGLTNRVQAEFISFYEPESTFS